MSSQSLQDVDRVDGQSVQESENNPATSNFPPDSPNNSNTQVGVPAKPDPDVTARVHRRPATNYYRDQGSSALFESPSDRFYRERSPHSRPDRPVRPRVRDMVAEIMLSDSDPVDAVDLLEDCRGQCAAAGVSFSELLDLDIDAYDAPPLVVEILRAKWANPADEMTPPLLDYLLEHTNQRNVAMYIRRAAMLRGDNDVYQSLRHYLPEDSLPRGTFLLHDNEVSEGLGSEEFTVRLQVDGFAALLRDALLGGVSNDADMDSGPVEAVGLSAFIASDRLWELRVGSNSLALKLVQGDAANVDARVVVLLEEIHQLLLPPAALQPVSGAGQHDIVLSPCFLGGLATEQNPISFIDGDTEGTLVLEMHVILKRIATASEVPARRGEESGDVEGGEWDMVETDSAADTDAGWVKASWSGKDEEL